MGIEDSWLMMKGHRLINTKYPTINLFDDVASPEEFEMLYAIQAITNPRLRDEVGNISLIETSEIPFHCERGRSYAVAPFTHINPNGGRFNDGYFGALYIALSEETAALEVKYHQEKYWSNIEGLEYDRFVFRNLIVSYDLQSCYEVTHKDSEILNINSYVASQQLARELKKDNYQAIKYPSVRSESGICWALFTPKPVYDVVQSNLLEMIWDGEKIAEVNKINHMNI
ncbi:RES family NAD+ phosphorylase [Photobacterium phosphoreum]|uniref:RES family NAD+ phosphorylase n=2 Tax=Photobacterium phosphoreum TaxID=659 RepID=UPI001E5C20F2|nr:RES family NAD+ phosphorylase [Photobacterium phosphoreum]MCD9518574.1 RES domain-containing protein [Photobacterium phosphoreum]